MAASNRIQHISSYSELVTLIQAAGSSLVVIDFFATWCGPCKAIAPEFARMSNTYTNVTFVKVDVDQVPDAAQAYGVRAMPTFVFIKGGNVVETIKGARDIESAVKKHSIVLNPGFGGDPLTGGGRYIPGSAPQTSTATRVNSGSAPTRSQTPSFTPPSDYVLFTGGNLDAVLGKVTEFNSQINDPAIALDDGELAALVDFVEGVKTAAEDDSNTTTPTDVGGAYESVVKVLNFPPALLFPSLDLVRVALLNSNLADVFLSHDYDVLTSVILPVLTPDGPKANVRLALKLLVNLFGSESSLAALTVHSGSVLDTLQGVTDVTDKQSRTALATVCLNYAVTAQLSSSQLSVAQLDLCLETVTLIVQLLNGDVQSDEEVYRCLVALGTILPLAPTTKDALVALEFASVLDGFKVAESEKVSKVAVQVSILLDGSA